MSTTTRPPYKRIGASGDAHEHNYQGQTLRHSHPGGAAFHSYFEHPEDPVPEGRSLPLSHDATGKAGTVVSYDGFTIERGATEEQYPLFGDCAQCGKPVAVICGSAEWGHLADETFLALVRREQTRQEARQQERDKTPYTVHVATLPPTVSDPVGRFADIKIAQYVANALSIDGPDGDGNAPSYEVRDKRGRLAAYKSGQRWA